MTARVLLILALIFGAAACGSDEDSDSPGGEATPTPSPTLTPSPTPTPEPTCDTEACELGCAPGGACRICSPEDVGCDGSRTLACAENGLTFEPVDDCELGCNEGRCLVCTGGAARCDGDRRLRCSAAGDEEVGEDCEFGCAEGACLPPACNAEEARCESDVLERCAADRRGFEVAETCEFGCADGACVPAVCETDERRCRGDELEVCAEDRRGFARVEGCEFGCAEATCLEPVCEIDERVCNGAALQGCGADRRAYESLETCDCACDQAQCISLDGNDEDARCQTCTPELAGCDGDLRLRCSEDGFSVEVAETCELGCSAGACRICAEEEARCVDDVVERCAEDGLSFTEAETCENGCVEGRCRVCTPNRSRCDGDDRLRCDATGFDETVAETCPFGCDAGVCQLAVCEIDEGFCEGDVPFTCAEGRRGFDEGDACEFGCQAGACGEPTCAVDERRCLDDLLQVCAENRRGFVAEQQCPFACGAGACTVPELNLCPIAPAGDCATPLVIDVGDVLVGEIFEARIAITNDGGADMIVDAVTASGTELPANPLNPSLPLTLEPGSSAVFGYYVGGVTVGSVETVLTVRTNAPELPESTATIRGAVVDTRRLDIGVHDNNGFVPLLTNDTLEYFPGPQGAGDVFVSFLAEDVAAGGQLSFEMLFGDTIWIGSYNRNVAFSRRDDGALEIANRRFFLGTERRFDVLEGAVVDLNATFVDSSGAVVQDTVRVTLDVRGYP